MPELARKEVSSEPDYVVRALDHVQAAGPWPYGQRCPQFANSLAPVNQTPPTLPTHTYSPKTYGACAASRVPGVPLAPVKVIGTPHHLGPSSPPCLCRHTLLGSMSHLQEPASLRAPTAYYYYL